MGKESTLGDLHPAQEDHISHQTRFEAAAVFRIERDAAKQPGRASAPTGERAVTCRRDGQAFVAVEIGPQAECTALALLGRKEAGIDLVELRAAQMFGAQQERVAVGASLGCAGKTAKTKGKKKTLHNLSLNNGHGLWRLGLI